MSVGKPWMLLRWSGKYLTVFVCVSERRRCDRKSESAPHATVALSARHTHTHSLSSSSIAPPLPFLFAWHRYPTADSSSLDTECIASVI